VQTDTLKMTTLEFMAVEPAHLEGAVALSRQAGWPHRLDDWRMALAVSEGIAAIENGSRIVGTVLVAPYKGDAATINMVIVDKAQRGRGLGRKLLEAAMQLAGGRRLQLVATEEGLPLYKKLGFVTTGTVLHHEGIARQLSAPADIKPMRASDFPAIVALDRQAFGADREGLIAAIAKVGRFAVLRRDDAVVGFAALRAFGLGEVIGPVVAQGLDEAKTLISHFIAARPGALLRLDTTAATDLGPWLAAMGLAPVGQGHAMQRPPVAAPHHQPVATFALASQAFG
jgi:predicted N-acetyltransferase YhbS